MRRAQRYSRRSSPFRRLISLLNRTYGPGLGLLLLRLWLGGMMAWHGYVTIFGSTDGVPNMEGFIDRTVRESLDLPFPEFLGYMAKGSEFFGGILVALGLLTRPALLFIGVTLGVAAFGYHAGEPLGRIELPLTYLAICAGLFVIGPGRYSMDRILSGTR